MAARRRSSPDLRVPASVAAPETELPQGGDGGRNGNSASECRAAGASHWSQPWRRPTDATVFTRSTKLPLHENCLHLRDLEEVLTNGGTSFFRAAQKAALRGARGGGYGNHKVNT